MITSEQQLFINKALPILKRDKRIRGVALEGSYVRKETMDEFSGLDFLLAADEADMDSIRRDRVKLAESLGTLLASFPGVHIQRPDLLICLYDEPLMHVDLNFIALDSLGFRFEDPVVLYETDGCMTNRFMSSPPVRPIADMQWFEDRFWIWVHYAATRIGRGELYDAIGSLDFLRQNVLGPLISMKNGQAPRGVRRLENSFPNDAVRLSETVAAYTPKDCLRALKAAANLYISLRGINKAGLFLREDAETRALKYLSYIEGLLKAKGLA
ncbi:MAG: aminoglycoside 6-adenylyltransferase [Oscillospiraceae bacterium]|jgi:predicted nucleotidyltransferase|nr:aminoglycoside 6-adenylyltransferase [Oscillospiraceae bacterium]